MQKAGCLVQTVPQRFLLALVCAHCGIKDKCVPASYTLYWRPRAIAIDFAARVLFSSTFLGLFLLSLAQRTMMPCLALRNGRCSDKTRDPSDL
eukprot:2131438-Rhodomonas_salina.1